MFNPGDNHACVQSDNGTLDYRGFNISKEVMLDLSEEVTGKRQLPGFSRNVVCDEEAICYLRPLHEMVMNGIGEFGSCIPECRQELEKACEFIDKHFTERIYLEQIC